MIFYDKISEIGNVFPAIETHINNPIIPVYHGFFMQKGTLIE